MSEPHDDAAIQPEAAASEPGRPETGMPPAAEPGATPDRLTEVRHLLDMATQRLLGDTIAVSDEDWRGASRLPGWSRGHLATHLARQADALCRLTQWARTGERQDMYASAESRDAEIDAGSGRSGLDLQIDLDTSAGRLSEGFESLDSAAAWDARVVFRGGMDAPATMLPLARLGEVVLHHVDLDVGFGVDDIVSDQADWLLEWAAFRLAGRAEFPALVLEASSGQATRVGAADGESRIVRGTPARLLGWLTGRAAPDDVNGADGMVLPPF